MTLSCYLGGTLTCISRFHKQLYFRCDRRVNYVSLLMFMGIMWCTYICIIEKILPGNPYSSWRGFIALFPPLELPVFNSWYCFKTCLYLSYLARPGLNNVCSELGWWSESSSQLRCAWPAAKQLHVRFGGLTRIDYFSGIISLATWLLQRKSLERYWPFPRAGHLFEMALIKTTEQ